MHWQHASVTVVDLGSACEVHSLEALADIHVILDGEVERGRIAPSVCVCVCVYIYIYTYIDVCMYVCIYTYIYIYVHHVCMYVCMYVCMCTYPSLYA